MAGDGWTRMPLGDFVTLQRGHDLPDERRRPGTVPILGSFGITGWHNEAKARGPGVTVGRSGASFGVVSYSPVDFWPLNTALYVVDFHGNDEHFTYYFLKLFDFKAYNSGSAQPSLNRNFVHPVPVDVPPLAEQGAIAHILGTLDDKIELNRRMNETLEAMAHALFKSWFIDFDPVRRNMARRAGRNQPSPAASRYPLPVGEGWGEGAVEELDRLFPDSFEDSELGKIPKGWETRPFADTVEILGGGTPKTSVPEYWNGTIPWFSVVDAPRDGDVWVVETEKKITQAGIDNSSTRVLPEGTTIISARGTVGRVALVGVPMAMNQSCYGLRGKSDAHSSFTYFATRDLVSSLQQRAHGSVFDTITRDTLTGIAVITPPASLVEAFEETGRPILDRLRGNLFECRTLAALRDTLLPKLISGELRVTGLEQAIPGDGHCDVECDSWRQP